MCFKLPCKCGYTLYDFFHEGQSGKEHSKVYTSRCVSCKGGVFGPEREKHSAHMQVNEQEQA